MLRGSSFITPDHGWVPGKSGILSLWVYELFGEYKGLPFIVAILIVFIHAILINVLVARYRMANEVTLLPGVCYILLASSIPEFLYLSPILLANTFFIIALFELFGTYRQKRIVGNIFNIGFWLGVASLFYWSELVFLVFAIFSSSILRTFRLKETLITLIGFVVPYILMSVYYFWFDGFLWFWENQIINNFGFLDFNLVYNWETYSKLGFFALLFLILFFSFGNYMAKKKPAGSKKYYHTFLGIIFCFFLSFYPGRHTTGTPSYPCCPILHPTFFQSFQHAECCCRGTSSYSFSWHPRFTIQRFLDVNYSAAKILF